MREIYSHFFCDDDLGEADAFYDIVDGELKLITAWSANDASFRPEYMESLFDYLGVKIVDLPKKHVKKAKALMKDFWGM